MSAAPVRTRFAPSPTGGLHLGNIRTALFNALYAHAHGGRLILRSEDTDAGRSEEGALEALINGLTWLGIRIDEGPAVAGRDAAGDYGPYRQTERAPRYRTALEQLQTSGHAYPCYCTREELAETRRRQLAAGRPPRYPGTCRDLTGLERAAREEAGRVPTIRFRVPDHGRIEFDDLVLGRQETRAAAIGDFVIARSDGTPAFFLANALDDAAMAISHVLRGDDHLANTPRQLLLLEALGLAAPCYGHFGLIIDRNGQPLSKRRGGAMLDELRAAGYLPEALINHLARIGFAPGSDALLSLAELAERFVPERVAHGSARHDETALTAWQHQALESLDDAAIWAWMRASAPTDAPQLPVAGEVFAGAVRANVVLPDAAWEWARRLFSPAARADSAAQAELAAAPAELFRAALAIESPALTDDFPGWARAVGAAAGVRGRALFRPLRAALTLAVEGPELARVAPLIPPALRRQRLAAAADAALDE